MMCPEPRATMPGSTARLHRNGPRTLTAWTRSHSSTGVSWHRAAWRDPVMPALLTSTSIPPSLPGDGGHGRVDVDLRR